MNILNGNVDVGRTFCAINQDYMRSKLHFILKDFERGILKCLIGRISQSNIQKYRKVKQFKHIRMTTWNKLNFDESPRMPFMKYLKFICKRQKFQSMLNITFFVVTVLTSTENIYERIFCYSPMQCVFSSACVQDFENIQNEASDYVMKNTL